MKKFLIMFLLSAPAFSQVGIGTTEPQATLHIVGDGTIKTGVLFPTVEELIESEDMPIGLVVYYDGPETGTLKNALYIYTSRGWKRIINN